MVAQSLGMVPTAQQAPPPMLEADYQLLVAKEEANIAPPPPPSYVPAKAPTLSEMLAEATTQKEQHADRVLAAAVMDMRLSNEIVSIFGADEMWVRLKEIEPQPSLLLRVMRDTIVNFVANQTISYRSLAAGLVHREEQQAIEGYLSALIAELTGSHFREGQGSFLRTLCADALSGMVALYHAPVPVSEEHPSGQRLYRVDPKVVFPVFGRNGVNRVYVVYDASYDEATRDFGDGPGGPVTKAIDKIARKGLGAGTRRIDSDTTYELVGFWDRQRAMVTWKGEVIKEHDHNLWVCPWHIGVPNWRQSGGSKSTWNYQWSPTRGAPTDSQGRSLMGATANRNLARLYEPFLTPWVALADKKEKVDTRLTYGVDRALDEALVWKRASANSTIGTPEIQNYRRGVTEIEEDEELDKLPLSPINESFEPWLQLFQMEVQAAVPVPILQGQTIGTQASGNAIDAINEMGYAHFSPVPEFMQLLLTEIGHRALVYRRDWSSAYDETPVPSASGYGADPMALTKEMLERSQCYVACTLSRFTLSGAAAMATTAAILDQQLHIGTRPLWIEKFGISSNPRQLNDDRMLQDMEDAPDSVKAYMIEKLYDEMTRAAAMRDAESLRRIQIRAKRISWLQTAHDMQIAKMIGLMPPQPEPLPGELPEGTGSGQPGSNPMPYLSAPEMARSTGAEGGAPMAMPMGAPALPGQV